MSVWFFFYLMSIWHQPVYEGERWVPAFPPGVPQYQQQLPPQEHFCKVLSPTVSVCA